MNENLGLTGTLPLNVEVPQPSLEPPSGACSAQAGSICKPMVRQPVPSPFQRQSLPLPTLSPIRQAGGAELRCVLFPRGAALPLAIGSGSSACQIGRKRRSWPTSHLGTEASLCVTTPPGGGGGPSQSLPLGPGRPHPALQPETAPPRLPGRPEGAVAGEGLGGPPESGGGGLRGLPGPPRLIDGPPSAAPVASSSPPPRQGCSRQTDTERLGRRRTRPRSRALGSQAAHVS